MKNKYSANNGAEITDLKKQLELKDHDHALEIEKINAVNNNLLFRDRNSGQETKNEVPEDTKIRISFWFCES